MPDINLPPVLLASVLASSSPGPATLAIAGTAMHGGRRSGLALAFGAAAVKNLTAKL